MCYDVLLVTRYDTSQARYVYVLTIDGSWSSFRPSLSLHTTVYNILVHVLIYSVGSSVTAAVNGYHTFLRLAMKPLLLCRRVPSEVALALTRYNILRGAQTTWNNKS